MKIQVEIEYNDKIHFPGASTVQIALNKLYGYDYFTIRGLPAQPERGQVDLINLIDRECSLCRPIKTLADRVQVLFWNGKKRNPSRLIKFLSRKWNMSITKNIPVRLTTFARTAGIRSITTIVGRKVCRVTHKRRGDMSTSKTERLVRKCFENPLYAYKHGFYVFNLFARAARRFCRLEQAEKLKKEADRLPKNWGKLKINGKWTKF